MRQSSWMLATLLGLGGIANADIGQAPAIDMGETVSAQSISVRGVAEDYLVMPSGGELAAQMKFITAKDLEFTDLALFSLSGRWSLFEKLELSAQIDLLPKQPSF